MAVPGSSGWQPPTGVSRGPEAYGARAVDPVRDALRDALRRFEAAADPTDAAQQAELARMREHTQQLERERGVWDARGAPGVSGDWNAAPARGGRAPPASIADYRAWRAHADRAAGLAAGLPLPPPASASAAARGKGEEGEGEGRLGRGAARDTAAAVVPPPPPPAAGRPALRLPRGATRAQVVAALDAAAAIDWGGGAAAEAGAGA